LETFSLPSLASDKQQPCHGVQLLSSDIGAIYGDSDIFMFRISDRCWLGGVGEPARQIIQLKYDPNLLVSTGLNGLCFWSVSDLKLVSKLKIEYLPQSSVCELEDGVVALASVTGQMILVSVQSMKVIKRLNAVGGGNVLVPGVIEIRKGVIVVNLQNHIRVWDIKQDLELFKLKDWSTLGAVKWAEGMFLTAIDSSPSIKGWNDKGECWLQIPVHHSTSLIQVLRGDKVEVCGSGRILHVFKVTDTRR